MKLFKQSVLALLIMLGLVVSGITHAASKPVVGIADFKKSVSIGWWGGQMGRDMADMLANELMGTKKFKVVERQKLGAVIAEQDLAASGRIKKGTGAKTGELTGAQYLITGTVTSYQEDVADTGGGLSFKGISIGGSKGKAYIAVDLRVIDTNTGEVVDSRTVEANSSKGGLRLGFFKNGLGGNFNTKKKTPAMKAVRAVIMEISEYLACSMVKKDSCINDYDAKENRRREKTKGA
ncbi:MAG TPA: penicillin-binding protein activator LpoB, partial [Gammaproteobacteria bacterium]|nr:penicillin-binding protein activator LpoB [Gammaproteobacteria bacterium]